MKDPKPIFISALLQKEAIKKFIELLISYRDFFTRDYHKLPALDKELLEYCLPIKLNFKPYQ